MYKKKMENNINLVPPQLQEEAEGEKKHGLIYKFLRLMAFGLLGLFVLTWILSSQAVFSKGSVGRLIGRLPVISQFRMLLGDDGKLAGTESDRINFLLMGIGGAGHDGSLLTDTIILGSLKLSTNEAALISIPRDLLVKIPGNGYQRINNASSYGETIDYPGGGSALAAKTIEEVFGVPIHYYLRIDFTGFKRVIDELGGVNVEIEKSFADSQYPTEDHEVQTISFEKGIEHMDGERALQYARSRHGNNGEGSDFARSRRQQKIILAIKNKLMNWKVFLNPNKLYKIFDAVRDNIQTNVETWEIPEIINVAKEVDFETVKNYVIDDSAGGLLKPTTTEGGAFVLVPKNGDYGELKGFVQNIFTIKEIAAKNIPVIVANGTTIDGLGTYMSSSLESLGFKVKRITNSSNQNFEKTVVYDLTGGVENEALSFLKERFSAHTSREVPEFLYPAMYRKNDQGIEEKIEASFIIVTGYDRIDDIKAINEWREKQTASAATTTTEAPKNETLEAGE
ncbi:MAG TPA: LCP family protein [bacterium]|nr:LCP family protein [bacterium]